MAPMFTTQGSSILHESGQILAGFHAHPFTRLGNSNSFTVIRALGIKPTWKGFLQCDSLITCRRLTAGKASLQENNEQMKREEPTEVQETSRRGFLLTLPVVFQLSSACSALFRPWLVDSATAAVDKFPEDGPEITSEQNVIQGLPSTVRVKMPSKDSAGLPDDLEEVFTAKLKLLRGEFCGFNVFIDLPTATKDTPITCPQFAGSFYHEARIVKTPEQEYQETLFQMGIGDVLTELGLLEKPDILVTFVPTGPNKNLPITLEEIYIDLE